MNVVNIKRVRDHIAGLEPEQFDMGWWGDINHPQHTCDTAACIGGWTEALLSNRALESTPEVGALLGLDAMASAALFYPDAIGRFVPLSPSTTTTQAVAVLDHLLATGEVDWSVASPSDDMQGAS